MLEERREKTMCTQVVKCSFCLSADDRCCFHCCSSLWRRTHGGCLRFLASPRFCMLPHSPHQRGSSFCCKTQEVKTCNGSEYMVRIYGAWVINHSYISLSQVAWCADIFHRSPIWPANWTYTKRTPHLLYTIWYVYNCSTTEHTGWNIIKPRLILAQIYIKLNRMIRSELASINCGDIASPNRRHMAIVGHCSL